jgi:hypothetical protein
VTLDETLCYVLIRRRMTPMGVPVTVHILVHLPIIVTEIIRRRKFIYILEASKTLYLSPCLESIKKGETKSSGDRLSLGGLQNLHQDSDPYEPKGESEAPNDPSPTNSLRKMGPDLRSHGNADS